MSTQETDAVGQNLEEGAPGTIARAALDRSAPAEKHGDSGTRLRQGADVPAPERHPRLSGTYSHGLARLAPGVLAAAGIAAVATVLGGLVPVVGAPVIAIVMGIATTLVRPPAEALRPGLAFVAKQVLQGSVVVLGLGLSLGQVLSTGARSLPVLVGTLVAALVVARVVGRALRLRTDLRTLIGVGTAICGASAIAATDAVIGAAEADVSYAIATIFAFNVVAVLLYPMLGHLMGLSQKAFGLWAGTAINDTSSVVAASNVYGQVATSYGVVVKLTRTLAIVPIALAIGVRRRRRAPGAEGAVRAETGRMRLVKRIFPMFVVGFVTAVAVNTVGLVPSAWHHGLSDLASWSITAALAAIGLSSQTGHIRRTGLRPVLLGGALWLTVGLTSLALQAATGTI